MATTMQDNIKPKAPMQATSQLATGRAAKYVRTKTDEKFWAIAEKYKKGMERSKLLLAHFDVVRDIFKYDMDEFCGKLSSIEDGLKEVRHECEEVANADREAYSTKPVAKEMPTEVKVESIQKEINTLAAEIGRNFRDSQVFYNEDEPQKRFDVAKFAESIATIRPVPAEKARTKTGQVYMIKLKDGTLYLYGKHENFDELANNSPKLLGRVNASERVQLKEPDFNGKLSWIVPISA
ncbi:MAG: hypothetical protein V1492_05265 [Candidatus Micrarchaeota archaeon]